MICVLINYRIYRLISNLLYNIVKLGSNPTCNKVWNWAKFDQLKFDIIL